MRKRVKNQIAKDKYQVRRSGFPGDKGACSGINHINPARHADQQAALIGGVNSVRPIFISNIIYSMYYICFALLLVTTTFAQGQSIKDVVQLRGARSNPIRGVGVVVGLSGNGDSPKGPTALFIQRYLANIRGEQVPQLVSKNTALVSVEAELPPFQKKGTKIDVTVSAMGDAKSLEGGTLVATTLIGPKNRTDTGGGIVYAIAQGRIIIEGDAKQGGNPTSGVIPRGAVIETELNHDISKYDSTTKEFYLTLLLKSPDISTASLITDTVNKTDSMKRIFNLPVKLFNPLATVIDGGAVRVRIPSREEYESFAGKGTYPNFIEEPIKFAEIILNLPFTQIYPEKAKVTINDTTKIIVATQTATVKQGRIQMGTLGITIPNDMKFQDFLARQELQLLTPKQLVDVVKALHKAGLINAEVITE